MIKFLSNTTLKRRCRRTHYLSLQDERIIFVATVINESQDQIVLLMQRSPYSTQEGRLRFILCLSLSLTLTVEFFLCIKIISELTGSCKDVLDFKYCWFTIMKITDPPKHVPENIEP